MAWTHAKRNGGPGALHRNVIVSACADDSVYPVGLKCGTLPVDSAEFVAWKNAAMQGNKNGIRLLVQIDNTMMSSPAIRGPASRDPDPEIIVTPSSDGRRMIYTTQYYPSQYNEIFDAMSYVSVEQNPTNGKTYWYSRLRDVNLQYVGKMSPMSKGYVIAPGSVNSLRQNNTAANISGIGKRQYEMTKECKQWVIDHPDEALSVRPDLARSSMLRNYNQATHSFEKSAQSDISDDKDDIGDSGLRSLA